MKRLALLMLIGFPAAALAQAGDAKAELKDAQGQAVGQATLRETPHGVLIHATLTGIPGGVHAFHIHQTGKCEAPFNSAGGHFSPVAAQHGIENAMGMHAGDMPNFVVPAGAKMAINVLVPDVTLKAGPNSLLREGGTSLVIHQGPDDNRTDPAGNAGTRIACGVIMR